MCKTNLSTTFLKAAAFTAALAAGISALNAQQPASDPVERAMYFVDRSAQATDLLNENKAEEALSIFQELMACCPDQDSDGYAAVGLADCLASLNRPAEARQAYAAALAVHPELQDSIERKLFELELKGEVSEETLARLRAAGEIGDDSRFGARWRLGRALQQRAKALLVEATAAFRGSVEAGAPDASFLEKSVQSQIVILQGIIQDLTASAEVTGMQNKAGSLTESSKPEIVTERRRVEQVLRAPDGRRYEFEMRRESSESRVEISVNGRPLELRPAERRALQQYQDRINAILVEAAISMQQNGASEK